MRKCSSAAPYWLCVNYDADSGEIAGSVSRIRLTNLVVVDDPGSGTHVVRMDRVLGQGMSQSASVEANSAYSDDEKYEWSSPN